MERLLQRHPLIVDLIVKIPSLFVLLLRDVLINSSILTNINRPGERDGLLTIVYEPWTYWRATRNDLPSARRRVTVPTRVATNVSLNGPVVPTIGIERELRRKPLDDARECSCAVPISSCRLSILEMS